jgi:hypothetical protein
MAYLAGLGDDLNISSDLSAIAAIDPEPISSAALTIASSVGNFITNLFGSGRREADEIVPLQNQLFNSIIHPIYNAMATGQAMSCLSCAQMYQAGKLAYNKWINFLHTTQWSDGRAAKQAENDEAIYWNNILGTDGGAPGPYPQGGLEQIFNAKACGVWQAVATQAQQVVNQQNLATGYGTTSPISSPVYVDPSSVYGGVISGPVPTIAASGSISASDNTLLIAAAALAAVVLLR